MKPTFSGALLALAFAAVPAAPAAAPDAAGLEFFEKHIRPVLVERCYKCHSTQAEKLKGGLLLDTREGVLKGGDTGPAVLPGDPEKSLLIKAVRYTDKDLQMPPAKSGGPFDDDCRWATERLDAHRSAQRESASRGTARRGAFALVCAP